MGALLIYLSGTDGAGVAWLIIGFAFAVAMTIALLEPAWCRFWSKRRRKRGK
jgi:hypothetical protein